MLSLSRPSGAWLFLIGLVGCGRAPTPEQCRALLDRYVEKLVGSDRPGLASSETYRLQTEARRQAELDPAFRRCPKEVSQSQLDCAMKAETVDRMEICLY